MNIAAVRHFDSRAFQGHCDSVQRAIRAMFGCGQKAAVRFGLCQFGEGVAFRGREQFYQVHEGNGRTPAVQKRPFLKGLMAGVDELATHAGFFAKVKRLWHSGIIALRVLSGARQTPVGGTG